jgi:hypothetical protein
VAITANACSSGGSQVLLLPHGHRLARKRVIRLADLAGAELVVPPPSRPHRINLEHALAARRSPGPSRWKPKDGR